MCAKMLMIGQKSKNREGLKFKCAIFEEDNRFGQTSDNSGIKVNSFYQLLTAKNEICWFFVSQRTEALISKCGAETLQIRHKFCDYYS